MVEDEAKLAECLRKARAESSDVVQAAILEQHTSGACNE